MNDTQRKLTTGQIFMTELEIAAQDKDKMLELAAETIRLSHSKSNSDTNPESETKRTYLERELPKSQTALDMHAMFIYAKMSANMSNPAGVYTRKDLSTDQRLILIKHSYQKSGFGDFDEDFRKAYPNEYGVNNQKIYDNSVMLKRSTVRC